MISFFYYLYNMIGGEKMLKGIDISRYQAGIDVGGLDVDFVIVKATEGVGYSDPNYVSYLNAAISSGKKIGLYHYARPDLGNTPEDEATWFLSKAKNYIGKAILVLDWEVPGSISNTEWVYQFLKSVYEKTKVRPVIYMSASPANSYDWSRVVHGDFGLWIASYGANTGAPHTPPTNKYWPFYILWQYTSRGHIHGYSGNLDLNYFYGSRETWDKYAVSDSTPVNPNPTPTPDGEKYQVGDVVSFNYLYKNSYAEGKVSSIIHSGTITRVIDGRPAPYLINRGSGWLSNDLILNALTEDFTIGSKVKTIKQGNGSSLGTSNPAKSGIRGVITRIIPGAKYPYLVSTTVPMGWYQKDALEKV